LPTCCRLVSDTANKCATRWQQVVVMEFGKTCYGEVANFLLTCYGKVANLLQTCYGETGVLDFSLYCTVTLSVDVGLIL